MGYLRDNYRGVAVPPAANRVRRLTDDGTGVTGASKIIGDYSVTPKDFWIQPPAGAIWIIQEVGSVIEGVSNGSLNDYGDISGGLTNGIRFFLEDEGTETDITGSSNFKMNSDLLSNGARVESLEYGGTKRVDSIYFPQIPDTEIVRLDGDRNMKFIVRLNDDFTDLVVHGYYIRADDLGQRGR